MFGRDALLWGLLSKDAKKICKMTSVHDMWAVFVFFYAREAKRDYGNQIRIRGQLYTQYQKGMNMDKYLNNLEDHRVNSRT